MEAAFAIFFLVLGYIGIGLFSKAMKNLRPSHQIRSQLGADASFDVLTHRLP